MSITLRAAIPLDATRICDINRGALGYECELSMVEAQLRRVLASPTDRVWVAWDDKEATVAGFIHAADYESLHSGSQKNIIALAVDPAWQGKGIGRMLTAAAEAWALDCGCNAVRLVSSFSRTGAHAFYLRCGYRLRKEQKNFIKDLSPLDM
jgi:GNAT superfamily N-acetyltransferase